MSDLSDTPGADGRSARLRSRRIQWRAVAVLTILALVAAVGLYQLTGRASVKTTDGGL